MTNENGRPGETHPGTGPQQTATSTAIMTRPGDAYRAWRIRRWARRELDRLIDPWSYAQPLELGEPVDWRPLATTVQERDRAGRELARTGWTP